MENYDLRHQLLYNTPLQKLYEKVYFEEYDLGEAVAKYLGEFRAKHVFDPNPETKSILSSELKKVIAREVPSIDPDTEFRKLLVGCPKMEPARPNRGLGRQSEYAKDAARKDSTNFVFFQAPGGQYSVTEQLEAGNSRQEADYQVLY